MSGDLGFDRQLSNQLEYYSADKGVYDLPVHKSSSVKERALDNRPPGHDRPFFSSRYENELENRGHRIRRRKEKSPLRHQLGTKGGGLPRSPLLDEVHNPGETYRKNPSLSNNSHGDAHGVHGTNNGPSTSKHRSRNRSKHSNDRNSDKDRTRGSHSRERNNEQSRERNPRCTTNQNGISSHTTIERTPHHKENGYGVNNSHKSGKRKSQNSRNGSKKSRNDSKKSNTHPYIDGFASSHLENNTFTGDVHGNVNEMVSLDKKISVDSFKNGTRRTNSDCHSFESESNNGRRSISMDQSKQRDNSTKKRLSKRSKTNSNSSKSCCELISGQRKRCLVCLLILTVFLTLCLVAAGFFVYTKFYGTEKGGARLYDMVKAHVRLRIINRDFVPALSDTESNEFDGLSVKFCREVNIRYLTSRLHKDYFGCTLQTASNGSIQLYYATPFLDTPYTSNVSIHKEILTTSRRHLTGSNKDGGISGSGLDKNTVKYGEFFIDVNSIDIFLEKYTTDTLPPRPKLPSISTTGIIPGTEPSLIDTDKRNVQLRKTTQNPRITTQVSTTKPGTKIESAMTKEVVTKLDSSPSVGSNNVMLMTTKMPNLNNNDADARTGEGGGETDARGNYENTGTTAKPLNHGFQESTQTTMAPEKRSQTIVSVLGDDVKLGEAASISCHMFTKNEIEAVTFKRTNHHGATSVVTSVTGDQLHTLPSKGSGVRKDETVNVYKIESTVVVQLKFSSVSCDDVGDYECLVRFITGSKASGHGRLVGKEPPGQPVLILPEPLVENRELRMPITCTGNVGFPPGRLEWRVKPKGARDFSPFEGDFVSTSGTCHNYVTNSLIYTPTRDGNGTLLKCVVVNEQVAMVMELTDVTELQILPENLCDGIEDGRSLRHPFTCTKYIRCKGKDFDVLNCDNQMCFDEKSGKCGQISLTMSDVNAILNDGVALIKCRLVHNGAWNAISIAKSSTSFSGVETTPTSGDAMVPILTATRGARTVTLHESPMSERVHTFVDESKLYQVEVNLWVELTCADEGKYTCEVDAPFHIPAAVGKIVVQARPGAPKLIIPNEIVEDLPMRQNISCEADVGYPHGTLVLKIKRPNETEFVMAEQQTTVEDTRNCSQIVTTSFTYYPRLEDNGMIIRCELENNATLPLDHKFIAEEKVHVIPGNFCALAGDQTIQEHPYDCHKYVSCLGGYTYVQQCGSTYCFDPLTSRCDREVNTETTFDPQRPCKPNKNGVFFRHPVLCNKFYWCVQGQELVKHCPLGTLYLDGGQCTFEPKKSMCYKQNNKT